MNKRTIALAVCALFIGTVAVFAQNVNVETRMNIRAADPSANFFKWSAGSTNVTDTLDATAGASKLKSTTNFNMVRYDSDASKQATIPSGLRGLFLYPIASWQTAVTDNLQVAVSGKTVIIRFVHRDAAYEVRTDANGKLNVLTGCKIAAKIADNNNNVFSIKPEFLKAGQDPKKMSSLDWTKVKFVTDTYSPTATRYYDGMLDVAYANNILTIKGTLTEKKK